MKLEPGIRIEFAFGVGQNKAGAKLNPAWVKLGLEPVIKQATVLFGGCTVVETQGDWIDSAGKHCRESGRVISVCVTGYNSVDLALAGVRLHVEDIIFSIKHHLYQEAICVTVSEVATAIL